MLCVKRQTLILLRTFETAPHSSVRDWTGTITYELTDPKTIAIRFEMEPPGATT